MRCGRFSVHTCNTLSSSLERPKQICALGHAFICADNVVEDDKLGEGKRVTLMGLIADGEETKKAKAIRAQMAGIGHVGPDTVFEFAGFLVADVAINFENITHFTRVVLFDETESGFVTIL